MIDPSLAREPAIEMEDYRSQLRNELEQTIARRIAVEPMDVYEVPDTDEDEEAPEGNYDSSGARKQGDGRLRSTRTLRAPIKSGVSSITNTLHGRYKRKSKLKTVSEGE